MQTNARRPVGPFSSVFTRKDGEVIRGPRVNQAFLEYRNYGTARAVGRGLNQIARISRPLSNTFNLMGRDVTYGRAGLTAGLGLLAARNGANMMDRMRYGDYGGAMMSGAMTAAAGYGAYSTWMYKGALRSHFNNAAAWIMKRMR
jgi:hypothetical protein